MMPHLQWRALSQHAGSLQRVTDGTLRLLLALTMRTAAGIASGGNPETGPDSATDTLIGRCRRLRRTSA